MRRAKLLLPLLVLPFACADDDVGDSPDGWRASTQVLQMGQTQFQAQIDAGTEDSLSLECPDGGSFSISGHYDDADEFDITVEYSGCQAEGVRIDGSLTVVGSVMISESSIEIAVDYRGELSWSGAANGTCGIDAEIYVALSGDGDSASGEYRFDGEICGHDAKAVVEASAEFD